VVITGTFARRDDGVEICPGTHVAACAGIRVQGTIDEQWLSRPGQVSVWRVAGVYDGSVLVLEGAAQATPLGRAPDYRNPCPEYQRALVARERAPNADERSMSGVQEFVGAHAPRVAGHWWDAERQTIVVWVTGDPTELQKSLRARAPSARICVKGHAEYSEQQLEAARARADAILAENAIAWSSSSLDVVENRVVYQAEAVDSETLARLAAETGRAVRVVAFIEARDRRAAALPTPPPRGDVELVTQTMRSAASMMALGKFSIHYDAELRCVYLKGQDERRVLPVWPFGFWATSDPLQVFDYDGNVVAQAGVQLDFGGGNVDLQHVATKNACGSQAAFVGQPIRNAMK
jgi:hypothetical protein